MSHAKRTGKAEWGASEAWVRTPARPSAALCARRTPAARPPAPAPPLRVAGRPSAPRSRAGNRSGVLGGRRAFTGTVRVSLRFLSIAASQGGGRSHTVSARTLTWKPVVTPQDPRVQIPALRWGRERRESLTPHCTGPAPQPPRRAPGPGFLGRQSDSPAEVRSPRPLTALTHACLGARRGLEGGDLGGGDLGLAPSQLTPGRPSGSPPSSAGTTGLQKATKLWLHGAPQGTRESPRAPPSAAGQRGAPREQTAVLISRATHGGRGRGDDGRGATPSLHWAVPSKVGGRAGEQQGGCGQGCGSTSVHVSVWKDHMSQRVVPLIEGRGQSPRDRPQPVLSCGTPTCWFCRRGSKPAETGEGLADRRAYCPLSPRPSLCPASAGRASGSPRWAAAPQSPLRFRVLVPGPRGRLSLTGGPHARRHREPGLRAHRVRSAPAPPPPEAAAAPAALRSWGRAAARPSLAPARAPSACILPVPLGGSRHGGVGSPIMSDSRLSVTTF